jgi:hypothetical protein
MRGLDRQAVEKLELGDQTLVASFELHRDAYS